MTYLTVYFFPKGFFSPFVDFVFIVLERIVDGELCLRLALDDNDEGCLVSLCCCFVLIDFVLLLNLLKNVALGDWGELMVTEPCGCGR